MVSEPFCCLPVSFALLLGIFNLFCSSSCTRLSRSPPYRKPLGEPPAAANLALAVVLLIVIFIQAIFNAWQDFSTSRVMASIKGMLPSDVLVLRDGGQTKVSAKELVPGDLVTISMGEKVPADLKLIEVSADLQFDRSILTGEARLLSTTGCHQVLGFNYFSRVKLFTEEFS